MLYETLVNIFTALTKIPNLHGVLLIESKKGFVTNAWLSMDSESREEEIAIFAMEAINLKNLSKNISLGDMKQQLFFFDNGSFLITTYVDSSEFILVVVSNPKNLVSEIRFIIREQLESILLVGTSYPVSYNN